MRHFLLSSAFSEILPEKPRQARRIEIYLNRIPDFASCVYFKPEYVLHDECDVVDKIPFLRTEDETNGPLALIGPYVSLGQVIANQTQKIFGYLYLFRKRLALKIIFWSR